MNFNSREYWENRYKSNRTSGDGSYGILCEYKSGIINDFIKKNNIDTVVDFGCGDGNQLNKIICNSYVGYDVSETIINICKNKFNGHNNKKFYVYNEYKNQKYDLSLSLDVIYHLIEDNVFEDYMIKLFNSSKKFVIIYSSNGDKFVSNNNHVYDRNFTEWIKNNKKEFVLMKKIDNPYRYYNNSDPSNTSISDFYIYKNSLL